MGQEKLTAVYRNHLGEIISFQTSEGRIISYRKAMQEAEMGLITGLFMEQRESDSFIDPKWYAELPNLD